MKERSFDDFDKHADDYRNVHSDNVKISGADSSFFAEYKIKLLQHYEKDINLNLLDFGCGDGMSELFIEKYFPSFSNTGIDISEKSIESARRRQLNKSVFICFDGLNILAEDESVDVVFIAAVFHHVAFDKHKKILSEIYRVMKPSARIYFFEHNPLNPATRYLVNTCVFDKDAKLLSHWYSKRIFSESHFQIIQCRFILFFPRWKWISFLWRMENKMGNIPLGAQYLITAKK